MSTYPADRVEPQDRSFKVLFPDFNLYVDAVPARIAGQYLEIPDRRHDDAGESERGWVLTNPEELTRLSTALNEGFEGMYVDNYAESRGLRVRLGVVRTAVCMLRSSKLGDADSDTWREGKTRARR